MRHITTAPFTAHQAIPSTGKTAQPRYSRAPAMAYNQGSHSLTCTKFQDFPDPNNVFHDFVVDQQFSNIKTNSSYLFYIQSVTAQSTAEHLSQSYV